MKKILLAILVFSPLAFAQNFYQFPNKYPSGVFFVCGVPAVGNPCSNQITIFSTSALNLSIQQPATIGLDGNYGFWLPSSQAQVTIQIQQPYNVSYVASVGGSTGGGSFTSLTGGTNTTATMTCGTGCSINTSGSGTITATGVQSGASLPAVACTANQLFNLTGAGGNTDTLYRCMQTNGATGVWQQIKPTVETTYARDYGAQFTSTIINDATTANTSSTITCPNNDCNFTSTNTNRSCGTNACVGDIVWATNAYGIPAANSIVACPQSTISVINGAQSITVAAANDCTQTNTATAVLIWGPDDTTPLTNGYAAAQANCTTLQLPSGVAIVQAALFNIPNTICGVTQPYRIPGVFGASSVATTIVPSPNFNFTNCSGGGRISCFFGVQYQLIFYLEINGLGVSPAGCTNQILVNNNGGAFFDTLFEGWCGNSNATGFKEQFIEAEGLYGGTLAFGGTDCVMAGTNTQLYNWPCYTGGGLSNGLVVNGSAISQGNVYSGMLVQAGGTLQSIGDSDFNTGAQAQVAGTLYLDNYTFFTAHTNPLVITGSGKVVASNSNFTKETSGVYNGAFASISPSGSFVDNGGNTFTGTAIPAFPIVGQATNASSVSGTSLSKAFANSTTAGSMLMIICRDFPSTSTISAPTDTLGNTWTQLGGSLTTTTVDGAALNASIYYVKNNIGGADTPQCNFSAAVTGAGINIIEITGQNTTTPIDGSTTTSGNGTSVANSAQATSQNGDLSFLITQANTAATFSNGTCNPGGCNSVTGTAFGGYEFTQVVTTQTPSLTGTWSAASDFVTWFFNIKPALVNPIFSQQPQSGQCTFATTTCTVTFPNPFPILPRCTSNDETAAAPIRVQPSTTQVILTGGTGAGATDAVDWACK